MQVENILNLDYLEDENENEFPTVKYVLPFRKKRKGELSNEEKRYYRKHSKLRM